MSGSGFAQFIPLILIFVIFYFFLIRPQQKKIKLHKEMVSSWYVVVREQENKVNLYCPPCWESALQNIKEIQEAIAEDKNDN